MNRILSCTNQPRFNINLTYMKLIVNLNEEGIYRIQEYRESISKYSTEELFSSYNKENSMPFVMVTSRSYFLYALREEFIQRFGKSPISLEGGCAIGFTGPIVACGKDYISLGDITGKN